VSDTHIFDGERCVFCNVNIYDDMIYGPSDCVDHEPIRFTTETPALAAPTTEGEPHV
jgi:hypothetical protein